MKVIYLAIQYMNYILFIAFRVISGKIVGDGILTIIMTGFLTKRVEDKYYDVIEMIKNIAMSLMSFCA